MHSVKQRIAALFLFSLFAAPALWSQGFAVADSTETAADSTANNGEFAKEFGSETITVTASPTVQAVQNVPISVSSIQGEMMRLRNTTTLDQALQYVPGVEINQDNISIRGSSGFSFGIGSRAVVLLDGFPMIAGDNGDVKFDALPVYNIERVEVVKGAGSALYGTSAIGGVINIITEKPEKDWQVRARTYNGIYPQSNYESWVFSDRPTIDNGLDIAFQSKMDEISISTNLGFVNAEGYRAYTNSQRFNGYVNLDWKPDTYNEWRFLGGYSTEVKDDWVYWRGIDSATFPARRQDFRQEDGPDADPYTELTSDKITAILGYKHFLDDYSGFITARTGAFITSFNNGLSAITPHPSQLQDYNLQIRESDAIAWNSEVQYNQTLGDGFFVTLGTSSQINVVRSPNFGDNTQQIYAGYGQIEISPVDELILTLGSRLDYEFTDTIASPLQFSPKFGASWTPIEDLSFRASVGRGFRAPLIAERYAAASFAGFNVVPNLDLTPETSWSYEIGTNYTFDDWGFPLTFDIAGFVNEMDNLIEPTFNENNQIQFDNIVNARIAGVEAAVRTFIGGILGFETSVTLLDPINKESLIVEGEERVNYLNYRSNVLWYTRMLLPWGDFTISADYRYKSAFRSTDVLLASQVEDAFVFNGARVLDARVRYDMENDTELPLAVTLNIGNAFNYYHTIMVGNLGPTRFIQITLEGHIDG